jgi:hypothetical protein
VTVAAASIQELAKQVKSPTDTTTVDKHTKKRQCADLSVKSQISKSYWAENSMSKDQFFP